MRSGVSGGTCAGLRCSPRSQLCNANVLLSCSLQMTTKRPGGGDSHTEVKRAKTKETSGQNESHASCSPSQSTDHEVGSLAASQGGESTSIINWDELFMAKALTASLTQKLKLAVAW